MAQTQLTEVKNTASWFTQQVGETFASIFPQGQEEQTSAGRKQHSSVVIHLVLMLFSPISEDTLVICLIKNIPLWLYKQILSNALVQETE